ncbi:MAG: ATP-dependent DNA ligase [Actinomycetota bacterium]|nr:ATP-dependent DNA ligase [Actinomycetota bacterium]
MLLEEIARTSAEVAATAARLGKIGRLASVLLSLRPEEVPVAVAYLSGELPQGTIGVGWASLRELPPAAASPSLTLLDVHGAFDRLKAATGPGSQAVRRHEIADLFGRATEEERRFLFGLLSGELRQGALEGVMVEAVGRAAEVPAAEVRRAAMLAGDLGAVAAAAIADGRAGLGAFRLTVLRPVQPMLAQTAEDVGQALERIRPAAVEWKLDGARIQVHRLGTEVRAFTRNLADATDRVPEVVAAVGALPAEALVLDGEAIALRADGRPHPFQVTMSRFGSRLEVEQLRAATPLSAFFFDCLHVDGDDLIDRPTSERVAALAERLPDGLRVPRVVVKDTAEGTAEGEAFLEAALGRGHEGVMVKALDAPYEAGRRGSTWLKVKRAHTLDLVVLAAEWGHGRRQGWLSNLHLGARDPSTGGFIMLGKTFKGMTDQMLAWQTDRFLELETGRDAHTVYVRPELVVEVAFDGLQASTRYPGGLALRFARVKGYRPDKGPADADTIETVRAIHGGGGRGGGGGGGGGVER